MAKNRQNPRKEIRKQFERAFDLALLDYPRRIQPLKPKALLSGIITAAVLYGLGYGGAYFGWVTGHVPMDTFAKLVWIMMLPTTMIGILVWQIVKNRMEYPIRQDILAYVAKVEGDSGLLWRFAPLLEEAAPGDMAVKKTLSLSEQGRLDAIAVEDYTEAVHKLYAVFDGERRLSAATVEAVQRNLAG